MEAVRVTGDRPGGMPMEQLFDYQVQQSVIESNGFDLLVMGRPEGPGCYCAANHIIRKYTDKLSEGYPYVVVDNEAGMEHISRRTTNKVDLLLVVSDPTYKGVLAAKRINELIEELKLEVDRKALIINRVIGTEIKELKKVIDETGLSFAGYIPQDGMILKFDLEGRPVYQLPEDAVSVQALWAMLDSLKIP